MRQCFIHIGTHKTGTVSLQHTLSTHREQLAELGFLFPRAGQPPAAPRGQHNIAWEISGDRRFRNRHGTIEDLLAEIDAAQRNVILSSEDFVSSVQQTAKISSFVNLLRGRGMEITFIVYFRNQIDYAKSLYLTLLHFGFDVPFSKYIEEALVHSQFRWRDWAFPFDYEDFLGRLQGIGGAKIIVRSYDAVATGTLVGDFLSIVGTDTFAVDENVRLNERISDNAAVERFYRNSVWRWPGAAVREALKTLLPSDRVQLDMSDVSKRRFVQKFDAPNNRVLQAHGLPAFEHMGIEITAAPSGTRVWMEDVFSAELRGRVSQKMKSPNASIFKLR